MAGGGRRHRASDDEVARVAGKDVAWYFEGRTVTKKVCSRVARLMPFECAARRNGFRCVAGVDEAGRGPLAGPIVAGAVVLAGPVPGLNDSKQLSPEERDELFESLQSGGHAIGVAVIEHHDIDRWGIQQANYAAMLNAILDLAKSPDFVLVDGFSIPGCTIPQRRIIKGDARSLSIAAASVVAKVTRDRIMMEEHERYPEYGFARHKGYATPEHFEAIERLGPCPIHRMSFSPFARHPETAPLFEDDPEAEEYSL